MLEAVGDLDDTGVWESIRVSDPSSNTTVLLQATLYMPSFQAQGMENNATRTTPRLAEPSLVWDPPTAKCNTKTVLQQLALRHQKYLSHNAEPSTLHPLYGVSNPIF